MNARTTTQLTIGAMALLVLTGVPLGCTEENEPEATEQVSTKTDALSASDRGDESFRQSRKSERNSPRGMRRGKHGRKSGKRRDPGKMLFKTALEQDSLTAEQRETIKSIMEQKKSSKKGDRREAGKAFRSTLAQAVREGNIDTNVMKAHFEARAKQREASVAARAEALNALHEALDSSQRQAVVADIKARLEKRNTSDSGKRPGGKYEKRYGKGKSGKRHGDKAAYAMANKTHRIKGEKGFHGKRDRHGRRGNGLFSLVESLNLTEEQQARIATLKQNLRADRPNKAQLKEGREAKKQCRVSFIESFAGEQFDPTLAACKKRSTEDMPQKMNQRIASFVGMVSILKDEQRNYLADRLENI